MCRPPNRYKLFLRRHPSRAVPARVLDHLHCAIAEGYRTVERRMRFQRRETWTTR